MNELIRTCQFKPYISGKGLPTFKLQLFDTGKTGYDGKNIVGYKLTMHCNQKTTVLFEDYENFRCSPLHAIDSNECIKAIIGFLCLRIGDTDKEYFDGYTLTQLEFSNRHAESLYCAVCNRFGYED
jgi:hypothetical protein